MSAVFLDRDGVIIENREDYVKHWAEVRFLPGALAALARLQAHEIPVIIITNQSAIGRGILTEEAAYQIEEQIHAEIEAHGGHVTAAYICPHTSAEGCGCRKPEPGMLLRAAQETGVKLSSSYLIGDAVSDLQAALLVGAKPILVLTGRGEQQRRQLSLKEEEECTVLADLAKAVEHLLADVVPVM